MKTAYKQKNAIKTVLSCFALALLLVGGLCGRCLAQDDLMVVRLGLKNPDGRYLFNPAQPGDDPITLVVTVENVSGGTLLASEGYADYLELLLRFADPKGFQITAQNLPPTSSGTTLPTFPDEENEENVEGEPVEKVVAAGVTPEEGDKPYPFSVEFDIRGLYLFPRPDQYTGKEYVPVGLYDEESLIEGTTFARFWERIFGEDLISNSVTITLVDDADNDGSCAPEQHPELCPDQPLPDCEDRPAGADGILGTADDGANIGPGQTEILDNGLDDDCNPATPDVAVVDLGTIRVKAAKYILSWGWFPSVRRELLAELPVRVFDISAGSCAQGLGGIWQNYEAIWSTCEPQPYGVGQTDDDGIVELNVEPGRYIVIGKYQPDSGLDEVYIARIVWDLQAGQTVRRYLWVIETAAGNVYPCKYFYRTGSELFIIEPEYVEWDDKEALYPFVFESEGDWDATTTLEPPKGFKSDKKKLKLKAKDEMKAVQFVVTDEGGASAPTEVIYEIEHKKKKEKIKSKIDIKKNKKVKEKGLEISGNKIKKKKK